MISLTPHASNTPIEVTPEDYQRLVQQKQYGWTVCQTEHEWLAKLHYLREGRKSGKIDEAGFREKEQALVLNWWKRFL